MEIESEKTSKEAGDPLRIDDHVGRNISGNDLSSNGKPRVPCPHCGKYYIKLNTHISRSHPDIHRKIIVQRQPSTNHVATPQGDEAYINNNEDIHSLNKNRQPAGPIDEYKKNLCQWNSKFSYEMSTDQFDKAVDDFAVFLAEAIELLPGPKHPAKRYFEARKMKRDAKLQRTYKQHSNPQRATKRDKEKRRNKYRYQEMQYLYYNQRRKAVRSALNDQTTHCTADIEDIENHFSSIFATPNNCEREHYADLLTERERVIQDETFDASVHKDEVILATKRMAVDTSAGPDRVLVRAIKDDMASTIIAKIATIMLQTGHVPSLFTKARTILLPKNGDSTELSDWRPITICSVLRRVIEKIFDARLRSYIQFSEHQRGFTNSPGTIINTALLRSVLNSAKHNKQDVTLVFLDISKAFDNVGHSHLRKTLATSTVPSKLSNIICKLQENNTTQIQANFKKTNPIKLRRGVMQGSPLSPALYNLSTDHIFREIGEKELCGTHGYPLANGLQPLSILGFADDTVIIGKNRDSAAELTKLALQRFRELGLTVNPEKSKAININRGEINEGLITVEEGTAIKCISRNDCVKYLGINYADNVLFDSKKTMTLLQQKLTSLASCPWLHPDQKFSILNCSVCPTLTYQFLSVPAGKIPRRFLEDADKLVKSTLKEILSLPTDTPDSMIYSEKRYKGLGVFRASWEALLQHINSCNILKREGNQYIEATRNLDEEITKCLTELNVDDKTEEMKNKHGEYDTKKIRNKLRESEFGKWCQLRSKGQGVCLYKEFPPANRWVRNHDGLSSTEWRDALKMTCNVAPVRAVPGRSLDGNRCRRCSEPETLPHVLGSCAFGEALRNTRHHNIRSSIAQSLREKGFQVHEEVHGIGVNGSIRRIDMIAIKGKKGYILDPTVRFEMHSDQPDEVDSEKKSIYLPTVPYYKNKYQLEDVEVRGLMFGARGTVPKKTTELMKIFNISSKEFTDWGLKALRGSILILRHHLYSPD